MNDDLKKEAVKRLEKYSELNSHGVEVVNVFPAIDILKDSIDAERKRIHDEAERMKSKELGAQARGWNDALDEILLLTREDV